MPEPARIALRVLGLVLLMLSLACLVLIFWPGPARVAETLGQTCASDRHGSSHQCSWLDAADLLWTGVWLPLVLGAVLRIATRPAARAPRTIDLRRITRKFGS
ncbi:hypothetical protein [Mycobacterium sp. ACS4331]|uniref:hypothetical protein n=1 Tax=Mycobacterium sp. ACS4331 TaxID=1834121 RepID=UPI000801F8B4|nr:hypothetical protein [Mycobacterium sp. ACS4331]OBF22215.1 hypothetical protein A5727_07755 [Mycobacterium sp. ACS4331]